MAEAVLDTPGYIYYDNELDMNIYSQLKNKETGIDISIPVYKEKKGLLQSTWEYFVVVVSSLPYFKSPKHKDSDVVQFMVPKRLADFEALHSKLTEKFPSTILPPLPRKTLITTENAVKERKLSFERFLNFIAVTNKLATCSEFLEFLGVNAIKAGKFRKDVDDTDQSEQSEQKTETEEPKDEEEQTGNIFDEADEEETDIFMTDTQKEDSDMFSSMDYIDKQDNTRLFDGPDLGGGIDEDEADLFFIPGSKEPAIITKTVTAEDNTDLLQIEDNLDKFLDIEDNKDKEEPTTSEYTSNKEKEEPTTSEDTSNKEKEEPTTPEDTSNKEKEEHTTSKDTAKPKPVPRQKPPIHKKPDLASKPTILSKPSLPSKPSGPPKPTPRPKPNLLKKPSTDRSNEPAKLTSDTSEKANNSTEKTVTSLQTSDILQYIEANNENEDVDLFS